MAVPAAPAGRRVAVGTGRAAQVVFALADPVQTCVAGLHCDRGTEPLGVAVTGGIGVGEEPGLSS